MTRLLSPADFALARERLRGTAVHTPLVRLEGGGPAAIYCKPESLQPVGSFKLRGAYNAVAALAEDVRRRGVITYSSGNHGQGVAFAARAFGTPAVVVMPADAPEIKRLAVLALGAEIVAVGPSSSERRERAEQMAAQFGYAIIPPYDDDSILAGQGTCGLEILEDLPEVDLVLAPVGGGGLLGGIAAAIRQRRPECLVVGVEPELAADAAASLRSGSLVRLAAEDAARTVADGLRTQSLGARTFAHIREYVDRIVTVTESEIEAAMRSLAFGAHLVAEPSGAVAPAALLFRRQELPPHAAAVAVLSGGNADPGTLLRVLNARPGGVS